jgi:hypothetical protein
VVQPLNGPRFKALQTKETRDIFSDSSAPVGSTPEELWKLLIAEVGRWGKVVKRQI